VRFEAVGEQTRVTVEHRGWDEIPQDHVARHGFELMLFQRRHAEHWRALLASLDAKLRANRTALSTSPGATRWAKSVPDRYG
jgi:hypothetical protein